MIIYWKETFCQLDSFIDRANARILLDKATGTCPENIRELKGTHKQLLHEMIKCYGGQLIRKPELFEGLLPSYQTNNPNLAKKIRRSSRTVQRCINDLLYCNIITDKKSFGAKKNIHIRFHPALLIGRNEKGIEAIEKELRQIEKAEQEDYLVTLLRTKSPLNETGNYKKESIKDVEENSGVGTQLNPEILNDKKLKKLAPEFWRNNLTETGNTRGQVEAVTPRKVSKVEKKRNSAAREKSPRPAIGTRGQKARTGGELSRWMRPVADHPTFRDVNLSFTPAARLSELLEKVHFLWVLCFTHLYRNFQFLAIREQIHAKFYFLTKLILASDTEETFKLLQARIVEAGKYCKKHRYTVPVPSAYFDDTGKRAVSFAKTESWITKKYQTHADWEALRDMTAQDMKAYRGLLNALDKTQERGTIRQYKNGLRFLQKYGNEKVTELYNELIIK